MLVLSRRTNEKIVLPELAVSVQVVAIKAGTVRLGIDAPREVTVLREEVAEREAQWRTPPAANGDAKLAQLRDLVEKRLKVSALGLALLREQLRARKTRDAAELVERVAEDLDLLLGRLAEGNGKPMPGSRKTLLVEDNDNERELLAAFLRSAGLDVDTAVDGNDALEYLQTHGRPDAVLMDMGLPRCDGATAVREIRREPGLRGLKVFAVSGHGPEEFNLSNGPAGVDRWFHKPVDPRELVRVLRQEVEGTSCELTASGR